MMDAFMHPPAVAIVVGHRHETHDGLIQIVSTVELWPWRTVVRSVEQTNELPINSYPLLTYTFPPRSPPDGT